MSILTLNNIHKTFEAGTPNENHVLKGLNFQMQDGDFVTIIGGNGAGKSTFLNTIAGVYEVDQGQIVLDNEDITDLPAYQRAEHISRVFQDTRMGTASRLSIEENLAIALKRGEKRNLRRGVKAEDRELFRQSLARLNLGLEDRLDMEVGFLSGGQRQTVTLLMATIRTPKLLLLDEHTAALDPKTSAKVSELTNEIVREKKISTLMITHDMEQAIQQGNRLIMLNKGEIVVDVSGDEKSNLTVPDLIDLFQTRSGQRLADDSLILG